MKIQIESATLDRIERTAQDALMLAQEYAKGVTKVSESIESLKNASSMPTDYVQRLTRLEVQFAELHALMVDKSPATKKSKLSKFGRFVAGQRTKGG